MSLRTFHLIFILLVIVCAELFGAREIWHYPLNHDPMSLVLGILALLGGLVLSLYALAFVRKMDQAGIR